MRSGREKWRAVAGQLRLACAAQNCSFVFARAVIPMGQKSHAHPCDPLRQHAALVVDQHLPDKAGLRVNDNGVAPHHSFAGPQQRYLIAIGLAVR